MKSVTEYLHSKKNAWSPVTLKNVGSTLEAYGEEILLLSPESFLERIGHLAPYSRKTLFILASGFYGWAFPNQPNVYSEYRKANRNVFKNAYQRKVIKQSYREVRQAIEASPDEAFRTKALALLTSAQRWSESEQRDGGGTLIGKGGKRRTDFGSDLLSVETIGYHAFRRKLHALCGITPHGLRKLALTEAAERGATAADLCEIAGWSSIVTAYVYLQPANAERLKGFLK